MSILRGLLAALALRKSIHARNDEPSTNPLGGNTRHVIEATMELFKVPGMSIAVVDGNTSYAQGYGYAILPDTPATEETLWEAGSTTKAFTAAALAQLIDSQRYASLASGWKTPINSILPDDFVLESTAATATIALEDAVTHRTGMPSHDMSWIAGNDTQTPQSLVRNLRNLPLSLKPRVALQYCHLMYLVLTHVIETLTRNWYGNVIRDVILGPLGMNSTYFDRDQAIASGSPMATGYFWDENKNSFQSRPRPNLRFHGGSGAAISNVRDYAKWIKCLLTQGQPFSAKVHAQLRSVGMEGSAEPSLGAVARGYGLGWEKMLFHGATMYRHAGITAAFGAAVYWLPDFNYGVVMFGNSASFARSAQYVIAWKLMEDKLGIPHNERYHITKSLLVMQNQRAEAIKRAKDIMYPNLTNATTQSPSLAVASFEGKYHNEGYGDLHVKVNDASNVQGSYGNLVARRDGFRDRINLQHVTNDYWIAIAVWEESDSISGIYSAEFNTSNGKSSGMLLRLSPPGSPINQGVIKFDRVDE